MKKAFITEIETRVHVSSRKSISQWYASGSNDFTVPDVAVTENCSCVLKGIRECKEDIGMLFCYNIGQCLDYNETTCQSWGPIELGEILYRLHCFVLFQKY